MQSYHLIEPFDTEKQTINVVIETPKGSRNKYTYDEKRQVFKLGGVLPAGASFPFDFGFVPCTKAEDGDPIDILLIMDEPAFAGCLVEARLIGAITAEQEEDDGIVRNDRLVAVAENCRLYKEVRELSDLSDELLHQIEHFFISYNAAKGGCFKPVGRVSSKEALQLVKDAREEP